eukprot:Sro502_g155520.2  (441) ;mRNA; r:14111-15433
MEAAAIADRALGSNAKTPQAAAAIWTTPPSNTAPPSLPRPPTAVRPMQETPYRWNTGAYSMAAAQWPTVTGGVPQEPRSGRHSAPPMLPSPSKWSPLTQAAPAPKTKKASQESAGTTMTAKPKAKAAAAKGTKKVLSAGGGDSHFTDGEVSVLLDIMERILPIGKEEFTKVTNEYNNLFPDRKRGYQNLKSQFNKHVSKKPPTGDPDCPPLTKRAKRIQAGIKEKAGMLTMANVGDGFGSTMGDQKKKKKDTAIIEGLYQPKSVLKSKARDSAREGIVQAIIASDKAQAKREERAAKRHDKQMERTMMVATQAFTALATAMSGRRVEIPAMQEPARYPSSDSSLTDSSSSSSDDSSDDGKKLSFKKKLKRYKKKKQLKRKRKNSSSPGKKKKSSKTVDLLDDSSSSGTEVELKYPYGIKPKNNEDDADSKDEGGRKMPAV